MEIADSPMGMRQRKYRETYRSRLSGWYNGYYHALLIFGIGGFEVYFAARHLETVQWWEWLVVPAVFLVPRPAASWRTVALVGLFAR